MTFEFFLLSVFAPIEINIAVNCVLLLAVIFQEERSVFVALWIIMFLAGNIVYVYYTFSHEELQNR